MLHFEWNRKKSELNYSKHGVSFEEAVSVFDDSDMLNWPDDCIQYGEERWIGLGMTIEKNTVVIIHTLRENAHDEEIIRIISARKANKKEKTQYLKYNKKSSR